MGDYTLCSRCDRPMRPYGAKKSLHPGTLARMTNDTCSSCYGQRGGAVAHAEAPVFVDVRTSLRAETFKAFRAVAHARGVTVALLLSRLADASLQPKPRKPVVRIDEVSDDIRRLNGEGWSDNRIAKHLGVAQSSVTRRRGLMGLLPPKPRIGGRKAGS